MKKLVVCTTDFRQALYVDGYRRFESDTAYACDIAEHVSGPIEFEHWLAENLPQQLADVTRIL